MNIISGCYHNLLHFSDIGIASIGTTHTLARKLCLVPCNKSGEVILIILFLC